MVHEVEAVYEHGVLRPLRPLSLKERQHVRLTISDPGTPLPQSGRDIAALERAHVASIAAGAPPTIEEVRAALASIPGLLSHDIISERGEY